MVTGPVSFIKLGRECQKTVCISVSTMQQAPRELTDAGYIQKETRFRERNRGQSSNLYILLFVEQIPTSDNDNTLEYEDYIAPVYTEPRTDESNKVVAHITFDTLKSEKNEQQTTTGIINEVPPTACSAIKKASTPVHFKPLKMPPPHQSTEKLKKVSGGISSYFSSSFQWTGGSFCSPLELFILTDLIAESKFIPCPKDDQTKRHHFEKILKRCRMKNGRTA